MNQSIEEIEEMLGIKNSTQLTNDRKLQLLKYTQIITGIAFTISLYYAVSNQNPWLLIYPAIFGYLYHRIETTAIKILDFEFKQLQLATSKNTIIILQEFVKLLDSYSLTETKGKKWKK